MKLKYLNLVVIAARVATVITVTTLITGCSLIKPVSKEATHTFITHSFPTSRIAFEENKLIEANNSGSVGVAFSGGGSRALSATLGYMKGLHSLGLLEQSKYISAVSGGAWASTLYTYLPAGISDIDFLGDYVEPQKLWWNKANQNPQQAANLGFLPPNNMGRVPQRLSLFSDAVTLLELREKYHYKENELWRGLIAKQIFKPFGLSALDANGYPQKLYSWNKDVVEKRILPNNPGLKSSDFYLVAKKRPFLIVNASMFRNKTKGAELLPIEFTPISAGIRRYFDSKGIEKRDIGGGAIQPFAFNSIQQSELKAGLVNVSVARKFTLADIASLSSAAFAETFEQKYPALDGLLPRYAYWPVANAFAAKNAATDYWFADGGNLENTGIMPLLARNVTTIVSFVNSEFEIVKTTNSSGESVIKVDSDLPPLFGLVPSESGIYHSYKDGNVPEKYKAYDGNQVFASSEFKKLLEGLWTAKQAKGPVMYLQKNLKVLANNKFNIRGGTDVQVLWVYNSKAEHWWDDLSDGLRKKLAADVNFKTFPHYKTIEQLRLSPAQVNLLAHMSAWNMVQDHYVIPSAGKTSKQLFKMLYSQ